MLVTMAGECTLHPRNLSSSVIVDDWRCRYFTSSARYALPYYATKENPSVLICYAVPGNPFPVIENPSNKADDPNGSSWIGKPLASGYQSHYVLTTRDGMPCKKVRLSPFHLRFNRQLLYLCKRS